VIIAIDGPAAAGKGTLARRLAQSLGYAHLDTGLIYRAVAAKLLAGGHDPDEADAAARTAGGLVLEDLARSDLRDEAVSQAASRVAVLPAVRLAVLDLQRRFAASPPGGEAGAVLDGRDIGTVVCPEAQLKIFVTASPEARAQRRHKELRDRGEARIYARVMQEMQERDHRDSGRAAAPLRPAPDAIILDTTELDAEEALQAALSIIASKRPAAGTT
jgi:cytidylate kinase